MVLGSIIRRHFLYKADNKRIFTINPKPQNINFSQKTFSNEYLFHHLNFPPKQTSEWTSSHVHQEFEIGSGLKW